MATTMNDVIEQGQFLKTNGLTLRDYIAVQAMQGILSRHTNRPDTMQKCCDAAYEYADLMLRVRERHTGPTQARPSGDD